MADRQCVSCGELSPGNSNFCSSCGASEFRDVPPGLYARLATTPAAAVMSAVRLNLGRVLLVSVLSAGLYLFYWFYLTWKQLDSETTDEHHPVWHALTLVVPIYGLFRMHRHVAVIKELAVGAELATSLSPGLAVVLLLISNVLGWSSLRITEPVVLMVLGLLSTALTTALVVVAQGGLNEYWEKVRGADLQNARIGVGEVVFVLLGLVVWVLVFVPVE